MHAALEKRCHYSGRGSRMSLATSSEGGFHDGDALDHHDQLLDGTLAMRRRSVRRPAPAHGARKTRLRPTSCRGADRKLARFLVGIGCFGRNGIEKDCIQATGWKRDRSSSSPCGEWALKVPGGRQGFRQDFRNRFDLLRLRDRGCGIPEMGAGKFRGHHAHKAGPSRREGGRAALGKRCRFARRSRRSPSLSIASNKRGRRRNECLLGVSARAASALHRDGRGLRSGSGGRRDRLHQGNRAFHLHGFRIWQRQRFAARAQTPVQGIRTPWAAGVSTTSNSTGAVMAFCFDSAGGSGSASATSSSGSGCPRSGPHLSMFPGPSGRGAQGVRTPGG